MGLKIRRRGKRNRCIPILVKNRNDRQTREETLSEGQKARDRDLYKKAGSLNEDKSKDRFNQISGKKED